MVGDAPSRDVWTAARPLPDPARFEAYAASYQGHIYFVGGIAGLYGRIDTATPSTRLDIYDPATDAWSVGAALPGDAPKHHLAIAVAPDGIYILGGFDGILGQQPNEPFVAVARAYALRNGSWQRLADPPLARGAATAQYIGGNIYVTGGSSTEDVAPFAELDIYNPATNTWKTGASLPTAREHLASCVLGNKMLVVGGWIGAARLASKAAEEYDPASDEWQVLAPMPTARGGLGAITLNGECHAIGGEDWSLPFPGTLDAHEVYDPAGNAWSARARMPTARHGFGLAVLGDALYAIGGGPGQGNSYTTVDEVYLP